MRPLLHGSDVQVAGITPHPDDLWMTQIARNITGVGECLSRMMFFGQASLRHAITQFMTHYHDERNHQGLENRLLRPLRAVGVPDARVKRRQRLGGMLSYCHREAA